MKEPFSEIEDVSNYAIRLKSKWRSLLDEDSTDHDRKKRASSSYLFRPRGAIGLDPALDPATFVRKAGDQLDDFELLRLVGQGGMGQVWEARQTSLDRRVALKLIRPDKVTPEVLAFFGREGRAAGRLHHPSIVTTHAMGESEGVHWIAQEFVDGECTLASFLDSIDRDVPLPRDYDRRMAFFFYQLADALHYAHGANIIHRDLKPQNVLISEGDRPKIADFGLARIEDEGSLTEEGALQGTPRYMSPEQALGTAVKVDRRSDVFSLGAMLYHVLTLEFPFQGDSLPSLLQAVVKEDPKLPTKIRPELSVDLAAIVMRAIEKRPSARYASMSEFADDLARYLDGRSTEARPVGPVKRTVKWVRRNPLLTGIVATVLIAVMLVAQLVGELGSSQERTNFAEWEKHILEARGFVARGEFDLAKSAMGAADAVRPDEPTIPLLYAGVATRRSRYRQAEAHIRDAMARGYDPTQAREDDALEQYQLGLYHFAVGRLNEYSLAEEAFLRAIELDPGKRDAWFPVYQIRTARDDREGAALALLEFKKDLTFGDPMFRRVDALILEARGEFAGAIAQLLELASDPSLAEKNLRQLALSRDLGRMYLYEGDYESAIERLESAVEEDPEDFDSWSVLASSCLGLYVSQSEELTRDKRSLYRSREAARRARDLATDKGNALRVLAYVEHLLNPVAPVDSRQSLAELKEYDAENEFVQQIESQAIFDLGMQAYEAGRVGEALEHFEACVEIDPNRFIAQLVVAQQRQFLETKEGWTASLEHIEFAWNKWMDRDVRVRGNVITLQSDPMLEDPASVQAVLVTRYASAACLGIKDIAEESEAALETYLATHAFVHFTEQLTYAEALVLSEHKEFRNPARARQLFEDYLTRSEIEIGGWPAEYDDTIQNILKGIGE